VTAPRAPAAVRTVRSTRRRIDAAPNLADAPERWHARPMRSTSAHVATAAMVLACTVVTPLATGTRAVADEEARRIAAEPSTGCRTGGELGALVRERRSLTVGGDARTYLIDAPATATDQPLPIVLVFHGYQANGAQIRDGAGFAALATRERFIAIHPDGHEGVRLLGSVGRGWDLGPKDSHDLEFVRTMLDTVERERCVDRRRIFATGMSNGGFIANLLGCRLADRLAAVAPVAGAMPLTGCTPSGPVAVMITFGRADDIVPPSLARTARDWWREQLGCRGDDEADACTRYDGCEADLVYCEGPHAHHWPLDTTQRIWRFFASHPKR
jgi:poly(3-hydroxybutyrate) depolymerase